MHSFFTCEGITADLLFPTVREAVRRIECYGIKVISVTADDASPNSKFFRLHSIPGDSSTLTYKALNPYMLNGRWIYFFLLILLI